MNIKDYNLTSFYNLTEDEKLMVLEWRNHKNIKKWMFNSNIINQNTHFNFINNLKNDKINKYFLVSLQKQYLGVIYFNNIDYNLNECYFGLYANPNQTIKNIGKILEQVAINYSFNIMNLRKLKVELFSNNLLAYLLHDSFGFNKTHEKIIDNKKIIYMEKIKEI